MQVLYRRELVLGKRTAALQGELSVPAALDRLLVGTGLVWERANDHTLVIKMPDEGVGREPARANRAGPSEARSEVQRPAVTDINGITITGTRIRGGSTPSPAITISSERMREEGFSDLGEVIRSLPQNFSGGQNPGVTSGASIGGAANSDVTGGSALNLRGLGPDATLTLLNGRRLVYDGLYQAVDISAIPVEAVERIEIVPDGASAIYGSDAVAGVANVILKRDFDGVTLGVRHGAAAKGGLDVREYTATAGVGWSGGGLVATWKKSSSDPVFADQRDYTADMYDPTTIYPGMEFSSGLVSAHQSLGDMAELRLDALKTRRGQEVYYGYPADYYYQTRKSVVSLVAPSIEFFLPYDWSVTLGGVYGTSEVDYKQDYLSPVRSSLVSSFCYCNKSRSYEVGAEGPLFRIGSGDARLAVGAGSRTDEFQYANYLSASGYGGDESSRYAYVEFSLPFVSPDSAIAGVHRLEFSAALRSEDYDSYGRVTTPKLGVIYAPSADITLKASWGKSFKAPTLLERNSRKVAYLYPASMAGGGGYAPDATALISWGGSDDLKPERARSWATSLAFHPELLPALDVELTWFDIDYTDRVLMPVTNLGLALSNQDYAEFIDYSPTAEKQMALLSAYGDAFYNYSGANYDAGKVVAIISGQYINATRQRINGLDLSGSYQFEFGDGSLAVRGSTSWLKSSQQNRADQSFYDLSGTIFHPAKYKSRVGAVWTQSGFSASGFVNYTSGVSSELTTSVETTASFTTVDAVLRYVTQARGSVWSGLAFEFSAQNLFNRDPPFYTTTSVLYPRYDSTNYSAIGRFLSVSVSKHW